MHHKDESIERRSQGCLVVDSYYSTTQERAGMTGETHRQHRWEPRSQVSGPGMKYMSRDGRGKGKKLNSLGKLLTVE